MADESSLIAGGVVAGTGHRPNKIGAQEAQIREAIRVHFARACPSTVISGMALGFDTWLAEEALDRGIHVYAAVPFVGQEERWPAQARKQYENILSRCTQRRYITFRRPTSDDDAAWMFQARNEWMVDAAHCVLACYDGFSRGGTANCLRYAKQKERLIVYINPYEAA